MSQKILNTRIQLLGDLETTWASLNPVLKANEAALSWTSGNATDGYEGLVGIKFGDGVSTWNNLEYFGGEEAHTFSDIVPTAEQTHEQAIAARLTTLGLTLADLPAGDIAIIKEEIADGKYAYTSYVTEEVNGVMVWKATDGNYSAANVFLSNDIKLAGDYGYHQVDNNTKVPVTKIGNLNKGDTVAAGTSIQQLFLSMLSQRIQPSKSNPSASISVSGDDGNKEVGDTYTKPTAKITVKSGSYTNEGTNTGVTYATGAVTIAYGDNPDATNVAKKSNTTVLGNDGSVSLAATDYASNATTATYTDDLVSYTFSGKASHLAGNIATDNLGDPSSPVVQIGAGSVTVDDKSASFRGYRKMFVGTTTALALDADIIRGLSLNSTKASTTAFEVTAPEGATNLIIACPTKSVNKAYTLSKVEMFSAGVWDDYTAKFESQFANAEGAQFQIAGKTDGANLQSYNVYMWKFAALKGDTKFRVTLK